MQGIDVVTVPDFQGPASELFEVRTRLFLGSWLENAGAAREWPLHLACIGEPPPSVRELAERADARISLHEPLRGGETPTQNKIRAFEVHPETDRILLLDTDIIFLADPAPLLEQLGYCLSVAPAGNNRVRPDMWERVYAALGEEMPEDRILCLRGELADRLPPRARGEARHREPMIPYYNTAALLVPWAFAPELVKHWIAYLDRLAELFPATDKRNYTISRSNQLGFTLALYRMKRSGLVERELPYALHGAWLHHMAGVLTVETTAIYHTVHFLRLGDRDAPFDPLHEVDLYERRILESVYPGSTWGRILEVLGRLRGEPEGVRELRALCDRIRGLVRRYGEPSGR